MDLSSPHASFQVFLIITINSG